VLYHLLNAINGITRHISRAMRCREVEIEIEIEIEVEIEVGIEVGIEGELTPQREQEMLIALKRIPSETETDRIFSLDPPKQSQGHDCTDIKYTKKANCKKK
jgi:hypothetical protein